MSVYLICEFDPLHRGHEYIMKKAKEIFPDQPLVCIMSGNFVQRGCPAQADKFRRGKTAALCGADLVLSLPFPWCSGSAEYFARGALSVISGFYKDGDALIFGSECTDPKLLSDTADRLSSEEFTSALLSRISRDKTPYAEARQALYEERYGECELLKSRNDILALEYIKAAKALGLGLKFTPVKRDPGFLPSSELRKIANPSPYLPEAAAIELKAASDAGEFPASYENFEKAIVYHLRKAAGPYAEGAHGVTERLSNAAKSSSGIKETLEKAASSAYTDARLRRAVLFSLLGVKTEDLKKSPGYTQLLAANRRGLAVLSNGRKDRGIAVITKPADAPDAFAPEREADELYCMLTPKTMPYGEYIRRAPFVSEEK